MTRFKFDIRPFCPDWGVSINDFYKDSFKRTFAILNPFIKVPFSYDKSSAEQNLWVDDDNIDYPTDDFILKNCLEIKWNEIQKNVGFKSFSEINHALITNGLIQNLQNIQLADKLYNYCDKNLIYYPPDGDFTPFNKLKIIYLIKDLNVKTLRILSEFGDHDKELIFSDFDKLVDLNLRTSTLFTKNNDLLITNHWDSFITILATNYNIDNDMLEKTYGFEIIQPDNKFTLDLR